MKKIIILAILLATNMVFAKHVCYVNKSDSLYLMNNSGDLGYEGAMTVFYTVKNCQYEATISNNQRHLSIRTFCNDELRESTFMSKDVGERDYFYSYTKYDQFGIVIDKHETDMSLTTIGTKWNEFTDNCRKYKEM